MVCKKCIGEIEKLEWEKKRLIKAIYLFLRAERIANKCGIDSAQCIEALITATDYAEALLAEMDWPRVEIHLHTVRDQLRFGVHDVEEFYG